MIRLAVTRGDPSGIGPEIVEKALRAPPDGVELLPVGASAGGAREALAAIDEALDLALSGRVQGIVTAPVSKERLTAAGLPFTGHTEYLAARAGVRHPVMLFVASDRRVALVTTHVSLRKLPALITPDRVLETIRRTAQGLREFFGIPDPRLAVCGLNPHAGEGGTLGREEIEAVAPAVQMARAEGIRAEGPFAADSIWGRPADAVVAMYHDQGLGPIKAMHPDAVNVTLGLPFVRTAPGHGTAFDIAGRGVADARPLEAAIRLAAQMCRSRARLL